LFLFALQDYIDGASEMLMNYLSGVCWELPTCNITPVNSWRQPVDESPQQGSQLRH